MIEAYKLISFLETAMALNDEDPVELELTRDEISFIISVLEEDDI